jgi:hypothetical protein
VIKKIIEHKLKTNILVIHDCFGLPMAHIDFLRSIIVEGLQELFSKKDNIEQLFEQLVSKKISKSILQKLNSRKIFNLKNCLYLIFP